MVLVKTATSAMSGMACTLRFVASGIMLKMMRHLCSMTPPVTNLSVQAMPDVAELAVPTGMVAPCCCCC